VPKTVIRKIEKTPTATRPVGVFFFVQSERRREQPER
jgi:hypothetical protein